MENTKSPLLKVIVINGSPKGKASITMQYVAYLEEQSSDCLLETANVASRIDVLKANPQALEKVMQQIEGSDAILFSFGVWVMGVSCQLMEFFELIQNTPYAAVLKEKPVGILSTSIHYFDHLAHRYLRAVCEDLQMRFISGISLDMGDLRTEKNRRGIRQFGKTFLDGVTNGHESPRQSIPLPVTEFTYRSTPPKHRVSLDDSTRVLLLTDATEENANEAAMVDRFRETFSGGNVSIVNIWDIPGKGGCQGCMGCGYDYTCRYRDGFSSYYNDTIRKADILVFCGTVKGRHLSFRWKWFFDRAFFWNHTPSLMGKQIAWMLSGPLHQNPHLAEALEATVTARQFAGLVDIITDEDHDSEKLDRLIDSLARRLANYNEQNYVAPQNFLAVAGHKIFRDEIWGRLRAVWQADYRFYKRNGMFDFPQKKWGFRILGAVVTLFSKIPACRRRFYGMLGQPPRSLVKIVERERKRK